MSPRFKKLFILFTIVVPFLVYCVIYYTPMLRNAPFKSSEFVSIEYKWGVGEKLDNMYNSATGQYQYLNNQDSMVYKTVKLRQNDIIYLHSKANELGLWNFPEVIANANEDLKSPTILRHEIRFNYKRKSKSVVFMANYDEIPKLRNVAGQMIKLIRQSINDAENRYNK